MSGGCEARAVLDDLAEHFGLDPGRIGRPAVYAAAIDAALRVIPPAAVVDEVVAAGPMRGAREPWGVLLARLRHIPAAATARAAREAERAMGAEGLRAVAEARHGERLAALVRSGELSPDEAAAELALRGYLPAPIGESEEAWR